MTTNFDRRKTVRCCNRKGASGCSR